VCEEKKSKKKTHAVGGGTQHPKPKNPLEAGRGKGTGKAGVSFQPAWGQASLGKEKLLKGKRNRKQGVRKKRER